MPFKATVGGAYKVDRNRPGSSKNPPTIQVPLEVVELTEEIARNCRYLGVMENVGDAVCVIFEDRDTKICYAQPISGGDK